MDEMMKVEEDRLLEAVDEETRAAFLSTRLSVESQSNDRVSIDFKSIAGFDEHIQSLKEMIALPLMYPEIFTTFSIVPPRGVIFFGPPGTGKTLMARALVNSCSTTEKPVAFFMRKGADILSKWVGESEKQLRQLFDQAKKWQPSIIFFDEIDGLAPVRTGKQDQIHSSIVSTLLSLMDGLDSRGQVVVIGATNRIDSIDPALRRPGRFDREFYFGLPNTTARRKIIELATQSWANKPSPIELDNLAELTQGYNGADVKALCTEAALKAVRRTYPELYVNNGKYQINVSDIIVINDDFMDCLSKFTPSNERSSSVFGRAIPPHLMPLLSRPYTDILTWIKGILPLMNRKSGKYLGAKSTKTDACPPLWVDDYLRYFSPRLSICGAPGMAFDLIAAAIVDFLESNSFFIKRFDHTLLNSESMSVDTTIVQLFRELKRHQRTVLYLPDTHLWWFHIPESSRVVLLNLFEQFKTNSMMLLVSFQGDLPEPLAEAFNSSQSTTTSLMRRIFYIDFPNDESKMIYFDKLLGDIVRPSKEIIRSQVKRNIKPLESIKNPPKLDLEQHQLLLIEHVSHQRQVRQVFSTIVEDLKKSFKVFAKPIDDKIFPNINSKNVLTLNLIEDSIQSNNYETPEMFVKDIHSILDNLVNDTISPNSSQKELIMKAKKLVDDANEHIQLLSKDFHKKCWYFYLFQKSILFNQTTPNSNPYEDFEADTLMSPDILSDDDLILQSTPTSQKTVQIIIPKSPSATSSQLSTLFRRKLVMELVQKTLGFSIQELEDLGILLASYAASNGTITMQDVSNALNIL
ncbi:P-loop containing nucleoside triphosphate hydrolase protein [Globomyces pollinis-pini]|nr:P-loop containing nucleoside triphosphate hydrolase protein [Globomyces pollinis-pini]